MDLDRIAEVIAFRESVSPHVLEMGKGSRGRLAQGDDNLDIAQRFLNAIGNFPLMKVGRGDFDDRFT